MFFVGHGSPMNAIENNAFTQALRDLSARLPRPRAVCVISAHWVTSGSHVLASSRPQTIHDFYGFPRALYEVEYPAPGAPAEAGKLARESGHCARRKVGTRSRLVERVAAHVSPCGCSRVSVEPGRTRAALKEHLELGREIKQLRERGVLILGSGNSWCTICARLTGMIPMAPSTGRVSSMPE